MRIRGERAFLCRGVVGDTNPAIVALTPWPSAHDGWLGAAPRLTISDAGIASNAYEDRPAVIRLALTIEASGTTLRAHVDRDLRTALAEGDELYVGVDRRGGVGVSAVRGGRLVFGVGALTAVPLGEVTARHAPEYWEPPIVWLGTPARVAALALRDARRHVPLAIEKQGSTLTSRLINMLLDDNLFYWGHRPLRVRVPIDELPKGRPWVDDYGERSEVASLARQGWCPILASKTSAMLLDVDGFQVVG